MKRFARFATLAVVLCSGVNPSYAKPPATKEAKSTPPPAPTAAPDKPAANPLAVWLLEQDGHKDAIALPLGEVLRALTHQPILPFDRANPDDAAFLARFGGVMDRILPRMNNLGSPAREAVGSAELDEAAALFEDEIRAVVHNAPDFKPQTYPDVLSPVRGYPPVHLVDAKTGKSYYLAVTLYPEGKREDATRTDSVGEAVRIFPRQAAREMVAGGCCLLVGVEYRGTSNKGVTFLNWDVTDVASVPVHAAITFQADAADVYHPGAVLTDGRKGSD